MAAIWPRKNKNGSTTWRVEIRRAGQKRICAKFSSKEEAEKFVLEHGTTMQQSFQNLQNNEDVRFTLRLPNKVIDMIDIERHKWKWGKISRNQWILETIKERLS